MAQAEAPTFQLGRNPQQVMRFRPRSTHGFQAGTGGQCSVVGNRPVSVVGNRPVTVVGNRPVSRSDRLAVPRRTMMVGDPTFQSPRTT